ncbi:MAG: murein biosynthesis integral membrane protein MurJ [Hyphomicrobiales bacterium]|nr:murein biosynthesis integral membrane protein MurJ [Hyphomicrobiales bacterium]MBV9517079.1 murein biosynthesis integral membrane protein MurJ [Hyphomicrobiales bacterium]
MSFTKPVLLVGGATALSRLLGFVRDALIAAALGSGFVADAFFVAFRLPNLFRRVLGEGALNPAFVPVHERIRAGYGNEAARSFAHRAITGAGVILITLAMAGDLAAPGLVLALAPGFSVDPLKFALAVKYTRLAFPFLAFAVLASLMASALNSHRRFASAALAPVVVNIILVALLIILRLSEQNEPDSARYLASAVGLSGLAQVGWLLISLWRSPAGLPFTRPRWTPELRILCLLALPGIAASGATQMAVVAATQVASALPGAVSWLYYADRLYQLPLGFIAVAMGTVLLPEIARCVREGDHGDESGVINRACELALLVTLPAAAGLLALSAPIVSVLFEHGAFAAHDTVETAHAARWLALALPGAALAKIFAQPFFARERPAVPLLAALAVVVITLSFGYLLRARLGVAGIALAIALAATVQASFLGVVLMWRAIAMPQRKTLGRSLAILASGLAMAVALKMLRPLASPLLAPSHSFPMRFGALLLLCGLGGVMFCALVVALGGVDRAVLRSFWRSKGTPAAQPDNGEPIEGPTQRQWADG